MVITKAEVIGQLIAKGFYKHNAILFVDLFFEEIRSSLEGGEEVKIKNFGNFVVRRKKQRLGRNPKTGEEVAIKSRRVVVFRASEKLKANVAKLKKVKGK